MFKLLNEIVALSERWETQDRELDHALAGLDIEDRDAERDKKDRERINKHRETELRALVALHMAEPLREAYTAGFKHGLATYAHWKNGTQYVGTCGTTLKEALTHVTEQHNFLPPV